MLRSTSEVSIDEILPALGADLVNCSGSPKFLSVSSISSEISRGDLFVALSGSKVDGHSFVPEALSRGALACVVQDASVLNGAAGIVVPNTRLALSRLALLFSGRASQKLFNIGITGTNGKTTTNWLIYQLLLDLNKKALRLGTLGIKAENLIDLPSNLTTPDALELHAYFRQAVDNGVQYCVMEASSHALHQARVDDVKFDLAVFTNLTRDHLDYHQSMQDYFEAKLRLFHLMASSSSEIKAAVANLDCPYGKLISAEAAQLSLKNFSYGEDQKAVVRFSDFVQDFSGSQFKLHYAGAEHRIKTGFIGKHNAHNIAATFAAGLALGFEPQQLAQSIARLPQVPGRLESLGNSKLGVYVDYAHTPDALENVLSALKTLKHNSLWVVFGCGGDRDRGKRPQMAAIARRLADKVVVTSDNPRSEDPNSIIADILSQGVKAEIIEVDRAEAIYKTLSQAKHGDLILIAGKGHEDYQIIGSEKRHFSDQEEVRNYLSA